MSANDNRYYISTEVDNTGEKGYAKTDDIQEDDIHYGWELGNFYIDGYSNVIEGDNLIFLKTLGDEITLNYELKHGINNLNNNDNLTIVNDKSNYSYDFGLNKMELGIGTLIVRKTNYQNFMEAPVVYADYLYGVETGADTTIDLLEEGDYEIALLYKVKHDPRNIMGISVLPKYSYYKMLFNFSIRNGNSMVFPMDISTGEELNNTSVTENGFYLDLAKSKYLDINIKKEVLNDGVDGLIEDTRYNKPAKEGEQYTEEGIYTITVYNEYTEKQTEKKIYVGSNHLMKAAVNNDLTIQQVNSIEDSGEYFISDDGEIEIIEQNSDNNAANIPIIILVIGLIVIVVCGIYAFKRRGKANV